MKVRLGLGLLLAVCASAHAGSSQSADRPQFNVEVFTGPLCDTEEQVRRYIALYDGDAKRTIGTVNAEAHDPQACGIGNVAFVGGARIGSGHGHDIGFQIVRILVIGVSTANGIRPVKPAPYITVFGVREVAV
jgi:hypothetical protein